MKTVLKILGLLAVFAAGPVVAQELAGTWQGKVAVDPKTALTIQFTFAKKPDGTYSAVLNSPDNGGIKNVAASSVSWSGGALKVQVPSLSGSYAGTFKDGKLEGQWTQQGNSLPLSLSPYQKPVLTKAALDTLVGTWHGPVTIPGGKLTFVFRFKRNDKGEIEGTLAVPEQGGTEAPMSDIQFANDKLTFKLPVVQGEFSGTQANGAIEGTWKQQTAAVPGGMPVSLKKGDYATPVFPLKLSTEAFVPLSGKWQGKMGPLNLVFRFETNRNNQFVGFIDSPDQKAMNIPITEASVDGSKITVKVAAVGGEYVATLSGKTMTGTWTQGPVKNPLTLAKQ